MDPIHNHLNNYKHVSQALSPIKHQQTLPTSDSAFPILAIAVLSIMATAFILVCYYIFVIKYCMNWHQISLLRRFSNSQARQRSEDSLLAYSPTIRTRGLNELFIRELQTFQFREGEMKDRSLYECVVCLNEFQEQDMLRVLPNCSHAFHLDCIDIWLQNNANCPLCRSSISGAKRCPIDQIIAPSSSPQGSRPFTDSMMGSDVDFVVIELMEEQRGAMALSREQERDDSREGVQRSRFSPRKLEQKFEKKKPRKLHNVSSMGDECIDVREEDDRFSIQPIRRSFSMDSASDRQLYLSVQNILRQNEVSTSEECSSRVRRSFFPFGYGRGSKGAVLPIEFEL